MMDNQHMVHNERLLLYMAIHLTTRSLQDLAKLQSGQFAMLTIGHGTQLWVSDIAFCPQTDVLLAERLLC